MRRFGGFGGLGLLFALLVSPVTSFAGSSPQPGVTEQVLVLLKLYRTYYQEGKYQQAEQVATLAFDLAPKHPETIAALRDVRRQIALITPPVPVERKDVDQKLDKVLNKLDQLEKHVRDLETQKAQLEKELRVLRQQNTPPSAPRHEPPGSPDRID